MPLRFLSDAQREQLSGIPAELDSEALDRFFTLSGTDMAEVRRRHGDSNRLGLGSSDVRRRYADPETYLLEPKAWKEMRADYCAAVARPASGRDRLAQLGRELNIEVGSFAAMLGRGEGPVPMEDDRLVVGRDTGDDLPASVERLKGLVRAMFPDSVELTEVVIAVDSALGEQRNAQWR